MGAGEYVEAEVQVKKGLGSEPANADLLALQKKLKVAMREVNKKEAALYSKMFKFPAAAKVRWAAVTYACSEQLWYGRQETTS